MTSFANETRVSRLSQMIIQNLKSCFGSELSCVLDAQCSHAKAMASICYRLLSLITSAQVEGCGDSFKTS